MLEELKAIVGSDEKILYEGKPNKKCYIFESFFNLSLPIAVLFAYVDLKVIGNSLYPAGYNGAIVSFVVIPLLLLHLIPVLIYLGGVLLTAKKYKNTSYIITDKAIYVSSGVFTHNINTKPFAELSHIDLHRGFFDRMFNVGDIIATSNQLNTDGKIMTISINSVSNYVDIYNLVKKLQTDIYTDVMYPNDRRPAENHGYNTQYKG